MIRLHPGYYLAIVFLAIALPAIVLADPSGNTTLLPNTYLNLETGAVSSDGSDILWNGVALMPQGRAGLYNLGERGSRAFKFISARHASAAPYSATPIPVGALVQGDIFGVHTNAGNFAKVIVTAANGSSLSIQYKTFLGAGSAVRPAATGAAPVITQLQNNYSFLQPGVPNYGIAPGSLFLIYGTGLSSSAPPVLQSSAAPGLPATLNQTSISVTVKGVISAPAIYYTSVGQIAAVLPSTTPVGNGTITVTYNGTPSAPAPIQVVASAVGLDTLFGAGTGSGVATDSHGNVLGFTNSATPGQEIVLWGSGVGADTSNDDRLYPQKQDNLTNIPMQVYIGGISADVQYHGRSQYPGVDQINVTIPANVSPGCYVSIVAQSGSVVSNAVTLPIISGGGPCSDAGLGLDGTQLHALVSGKTPVKSAVVSVGQFTNGNGNVSVAAVAAFSTFSASEFGAGYGYASQGSCTRTVPNFSFDDLGIAGSATALDPGTIQVTGPAGMETLQELGVGGLYVAGFSSNSLTPGTYTFSSSGGKDVKAFQVAIDAPAPFALTNHQAALASIDRSQGFTVTWTGGFPNGTAVVNGSAPTPAGSVSFVCYGPSSAGQLTIPSSILLALPPGPGKLGLVNVTLPLTVPGVGFSIAAPIVSVSMSTTYK